MGYIGFTMSVRRHDLFCMITVLKCCLSDSFQTFVYCFGGEKEGLLFAILYGISRLKNSSAGFMYSVLFDFTTEIIQKSLARRIFVPFCGQL